MKKVGLMVVAASIAFGGTIETVSQDGINALHVGLSRTASADFLDYLRDGVDGLKTNSKLIWKKIQSVSCDDVIASAVDVKELTKLFGKAVEMPATCLAQFNAGFICSVPSAILDIAQLAMGSLEAAWKNKWKCLAAGVTTAGAGVALCGFYHYFKPKAEKMAGCIKQLFYRDQLLGILVDSLFSTTCNLLGQLTLQALVEFLTFGGATPGIVTKWLTKLIQFGNKLSPSQLTGFLDKAKTKTSLALDMAKKAQLRNRSPGAEKLTKRLAATLEKLENKQGKLDGIVDYAQNLMGELSGCN